MSLGGTSVLNGPAAIILSKRALVPFTFILIFAELDHKWWIEQRWAAHTHAHACTHTHTYTHTGAVHKVRHAQREGVREGGTVCDRGGGVKSMWLAAYKNFL